MTPLASKRKPKVRREELAPGLRGFTAGSYLIFYRPLPDSIEVVRVAHGSRDLPSIFDS